MSPAQILVQKTRGAKLKGKSNVPVLCLACGKGGENGPLRKQEVYCHGGVCKEVVSDGLEAFKAYTSEARSVNVVPEGPATGIGIASGYVQAPPEVAR